MSTPRRHGSDRYCICEGCDTVYRLPELQTREIAHCARCGAVIARHHRFNIDALAALVVAALIVFIEGNIWPVVTLGLNGKEVSATLWGMILIVWHDHSQIVAAVQHGDAGLAALVRPPRRARTRLSTLDGRTPSSRTLDDE